MKDDVVTTLGHCTGKAAQPFSLVADDELSLSETMDELQRKEEMKQRPSEEPIAGSTAISVSPISAEFDAVGGGPVKLEKSPIVMSVVRQVHRASTAVGMPWNKPRQVMNDVAVLFAQAMEMNDYFQSKVKGWAACSEGTQS